MIIDTHTHIQFPAYDSDRSEVLRRACEKNIKIICVGTTLSNSLQAIELSRENFGDILATVGFHPSHLNLDWHFDKNELKKPEREILNIAEMEKLACAKEVVAIGEVGLDYYRLTNPEKEKKLQKEAMYRIMGVAQKLNKPLMIHCRPSKNSQDAYEDLLEMFKGFLPEADSPSMESFNGKIILHFFVGNLEIAKKFLNIGACFTFGGVITFSRDYDEVIKYIPSENIFLETDAPYVAPKLYRGKRNEPSYIIETAQKLAEIKNTSLENLLEIQEISFKRVFANSF